MGVVAGSYGSHGLVKKADDERQVKLWKTANEYHYYHAFGLILCGLVPRPYSILAGVSFLTGITLFSGWFPLNSI